jgi:hypothetical protein
MDHWQRFGLELSLHSAIATTSGRPPERWKKQEPTCKTGTWGTRRKCRRADI